MYFTRCSIYYFYSAKDMDTRGIMSCGNEKVSHYKQQKIKTQIQAAS